jgi:enediyne biosynthesis protein E4
MKMTLAALLAVTAILISASHHDLLQASQGSAAAGTLSFTDITAAAGMASTTTGSHGAFWADATGDGLVDLYLTYNDCESGRRANRFYRNLGGGRFVEEARARGIDNLSGGTHGAGWADLDNDGDYDLLNGMTFATDCTDPGAALLALPNRLFRNDGTGLFVDRTPPAMLAYADYTRSTLAFDMDRDGDLDIFAVNGFTGINEPIPDRNELYRNDGGMTFTAITTGPLISTPAGQGGTATDYDNDGDVDILLSNFNGDLGVLRNDGGGTFTAVPPTSIGIYHRASTGISSGDLNGDGLFDLVLIDQDRTPGRHLGYDRVAYIYLNAGGGRFTYHLEIPSGYFGGFTAGLADLDNDGDLDIILPGLPMAVLNDGAANFTVGPSYPTPTPPPGCLRDQCTKPDMRTVAFADIDNDGDLDSVVTTKFGAFYMIRNNFSAGHWLKVGLVSPQGQAGAFGSKVRVFRAGTTSLIAIREATSGYGYLSQDDPVLHFGLGSATTVDVEVTFLDGTKAVARGISANQTIFFNGITLLESPGAPQNVAAVVSGNNVTLSWQPPASGGAVASYQLEAGSVPGASDIALFPMGAATTFSVGAPNGVYYVRVRARNAVGLSAASNEIIVDVGNCRAAAPTNLTFTRAGALVTLTWTAPSGGPALVGYRLEVGSVSGAANLLVHDTTGAATSLSATAAPGRYYVRIRARTSCGIGAVSNEIVIDMP